MPTPVDGLPEPIVLWQEGDGWVVRHERTGCTTEGDTRIHALLRLVDLLADEDGYSLEEVRTLADETFASDHGDLPDA